MAPAYGESRFEKLRLVSYAFVCRDVFICTFVAPLLFFRGEKEGFAIWAADQWLSYIAHAPKKDEGCCGACASYMVVRSAGSWFVSGT